MGNATSQERGRDIWRAVSKNDGRLLGELIQDLALTGQERSWVGKDGRTALSLAAKKDFHECAMRLLVCGADVHYMNPREDAHGGTALHEATRHRHEAMAELLLSYGANPFVCDALGRTCMDEAVLHGSGNLFRRFEQLATWRGSIAVKMSKLGGLSEEYKARYLIVIPVTPYADIKQQEQDQTNNNSTPAEARQQLWVMKDNHSLTPNTCVWLDGAQLTRTSRQEATLRLHPSHKAPPGGVVTRYERGYSISLRTQDFSPACTAALDQLQALISRVGSAATPAAAQPLSTPGQPSIMLQMSPDDTPVPPGAPMVVGIIPLPLTTGSGSSRMATPRPELLTPAPPATPAAPAVGSLGVMGMQPPAQPSAGPTIPTMTPRLLSTPVTPPPTPPPTMPLAAPLTPTLAPPLTTPRNTAMSSPIAHLATPTPQPSAPGPMTAARRLLANRQAPSLTALLPPVSVTPASRQAYSSTAIAPPVAPASCQAYSYTATVPPVAAAAAAQRPCRSPCQVDRDDDDCCSTAATCCEPSAPPLQAVANVFAMGGCEGEERMCVMCKASPREAGYLHGASLHICVCRDCCSHVAPGAPCPLCRQPVERVINVF